MTISCTDPLIQNLIRKLGLPASTRRFELHVSSAGPVKVICEYHPDAIEGPASETITEEYQLIKKD